MIDITSYSAEVDTLGHKDKYKNRISLSINLKDDEELVLEISEKQLQQIKERVGTYTEYVNKKETYLITAVRNLIKKTNFLELYQHLLEEEISEEDFKEELNKESKKYTIEIAEFNDPDGFMIIADIAQKIMYDLKEFSMNEVCEIFSIDEEGFLKSNKLISDNK